MDGDKIQYGDRFEWPKCLSSHCLVPKNKNVLVTHSEVIADSLFSVLNSLVFCVVSTVHVCAASIMPNVKCQMLLMLPIWQIPNLVVSFRNSQFSNAFETFVWLQRQPQSFWSWERRRVCVEFLIKLEYHSRLFTVEVYSINVPNLPVINQIDPIILSNRGWIFMTDNYGDLSKCQIIEAKLT